MTIEATGTTAKTMRVDAALAKRLAKDAGRRHLAPVWIGAAVLAVICLGWPIFFTGNPRSLMTGGFWLFIALTILIAARAMRAPAMLRLIEGVYPRGDELAVEIDETGVTTTTSIAHVHIPARAITSVAVARHSVSVRVSGIAGQGVVLPRELVDDAAVATLRAAASRARRR
ncbi:hypothetical protein [Microbacterium dauci]|uniref:DUF304 domain-containing protein n=1 Tax=Microbacterium dauci TaxID=3048008 RepID=A0ABT6ZF73_9MICO|nr:hypothetical protein [Microbacterium sp. LX3-4]MDJ1114375.1 hypothetical protein [Microbacterium sp. LX3-4]